MNEWDDSFGTIVNSLLVETTSQFDTYVQGGKGIRYGTSDSWDSSIVSHIYGPYRDALTITTEKATRPRARLHTEGKQTLSPSLGAELS